MHYMYWIGPKSSIMVNSSRSPSSAITRAHTTIASFALTLALSLLYGLLSGLEHRSSIRPPFLISSSLALSILFDMARARPTWMLPNAGSGAILALFTTSLALKAVILIRVNRDMIHLTRGIQKCSVEGASGLYNLGVFYWLSSLFFAGYRKILMHEDLYPLDGELRSELLAKKTSEAWGKVPNKSKPGALFGAWIGDFVGPLTMPDILRLLQIGFTYAQLFLITATTELAVRHKRSNSITTATDSPEPTFLYTLVSAGQSEWQNYGAVTMMRGSVIPLVYEKTLRVDSSNSFTISPTGSLTRISTDIETISGGFPQFHETRGNLIEIGLTVYLLERQLSASCVMGVGFAIVVMLGSGLLAALTRRHRAEWIAASQRRVTTTSKTLGSVK
ncbi:hypothetical protein V8C37DRAFT_26647 [Trichoderma ceciliae]